jgi:hypothetical protein
MCVPVSAYIHVYHAFLIHTVHTRVSGDLHALQALGSEDAFRHVPHTLVLLVHTVCISCLSLCVYVYVYLHLYMYICMYVYINTYIHTYIHMCISVCLYFCV